MKKLTFLIILCFACTFIQAQRDPASVGAATFNSSYDATQSMQNYGNMMIQQQQLQQLQNQQLLQQLQQLKVQQELQQIQQQQNTSNTQSTTKEKNIEWYIATAVSEDGIQKIKVKYQLNELNEVCVECDSYILHDSKWSKNYIYKDDKGYYIFYFATKCYLF
jgi:hypothetical protein